MSDIKPEIKHGNLTLTPQAPAAGGAGWIASVILFCCCNCFSFLLWT